MNYGAPACSLDYEFCSVILLKLAKPVRKQHFKVLRASDTGPNVGTRYKASQSVSPSDTLKCLKMKGEVMEGI